MFWHLGAALYRFMGVEPQTAGTSHSEDDIRKMVSASEKGGSIDPVESRLIDNVFDFADRVAREVMVPRQDMVCLFVDVPIEENMKVIRESCHTRYPLCEEDRDHILGMVHIREFMNADYKQPGFDLRSIMREIDVVPESMSIAKILQLMQHKHVQMAAVADEYGGTAGLVTLEDLLEELVGNIYDEFDPQAEQEIIQLEENLWRVSGSADLEELAEALDCRLPEDEDRDYDTLGGLVFAQLAVIPEDGSRPVVEALGLRIRVEALCDRRVEWALVEKQAPAAAACE